MLYLSEFNTDIINKLIKYRKIFVKIGCLKLIFNLKKYISEEICDYYRYVIIKYNIKSYNDYKYLFDILKEHIEVKMFLNLNYFYVDKKCSELYKCLFTTLEPSYNVIKALDCVNFKFDGYNGMNVSSKFTTPSSLRFTTPNILLYYFKKYLNQYIYKNESLNIPSKIITFNDKYIIDGRFTYIKHFLETPNTPIVITNIFYTSNPDKILNFINNDCIHLENNRFKIDEYLADDIIDSNFLNNQIFKNIWNYKEKDIFFNKETDLKNTIKYNFKILCGLYR